ncbi:Uncharacterized protein dnm_049760 [Desulfonema magnum]|uniref:Uncharacterized protein n=1 Tax=Desulfonema magnum TaxID=45655 RepID=A0A975BPR4_9BACT|nr:Uncharacterized protein dnm_049760 [Desulfonema magnum]
MTWFEQTVCHSCESRNPFLADAAVPGTVDSCFRRNDRKKNLIIGFQQIEQVEKTRQNPSFAKM